jgi:hypothetical protein
MGSIEPNTKVLEDGTAALLEGSEAAVVDAGDEEVVSFAELAGEKPLDVAPAAAAPAAKPAAKPAATAAATPNDEEADLPEEYRGKTKKQIAEMHRNAHATIGRQGSELAKFRQLADAYLRRGIQHQTQAAQAGIQQPAQQPAVEPVDETAVFAKPLEAINKLIEQHPAVQEIKRTLGQTEANAAVKRATEAKARFDAAHPDAKTIVQDPEFRQWVQASPMRMKMLAAADRNYNFEAGDELFGTWKALRKVAAPAAAAGTEGGASAGEAPAGQQPAGQPSEAEVKAAATTLARARAAKQALAASAAAVPTGGASGATKPGAGAKRIYKRVDLIELQIANPDRYDAMQDEITAAYREGRVR